MDAQRLSPGRPWPLGATYDGRGVNFALFAGHAARVELFVRAGNETQTLAVEHCTDGVWHLHLAGAASDLAYAYRVFGAAPRAPGDRFEPARLVLDPYARRLCGRFSWDAADDRASVYGLLGEVLDQTRTTFDWGGDRPPATPWAETLLYEVHVRGATMRHPAVPHELRGTYGGLATSAMIEHYRRLGVTALSLLPIQQHLDEERLVRGGRANYWGYNPINFFAPEPRYAKGDGRQALDEFRAMVRELHRHEIEVILDVVFNHTAESDANGPTLSWRGIDNRRYYRLSGNGARYENHSGCGNTFNLAEPRALQQVMDALRFWVGDCHVDGFRFDLTTSLVRDSAFLAVVAQDPLMQGVKLIAEPWDVGPDGYRLGRFPAGWSEWNDRFRDNVRGFWLTGDFGTDALAQRLAGSSEAFCHDGRAPQAGVNYVAAHDGFTLHDLVCYREKHNESNGEDNRDGHAVNFSANLGEEGETVDPLVHESRQRLVRALLATLFLAQGVPMLQAGDELGRTQDGNNNAYCHDDPLTWINWAHGDSSLISYVERLSALRRRYPALRQRVWLTGEVDDDGRADCCWMHPEGRPMNVSDWHDHGLDTFAFWIALDRWRRAGLLCLFNRAADAVPFGLPAGPWRTVFDTTREVADETCEGMIDLAGRSVRVLESCA